MSRQELQLLKEAAARIAQKCDTPEKAQEHLIKIGYLDESGKVIERVR